MSNLHKMHQLSMLKLILTSQTLVVKGLCQRPIRIPIFFWLSFSIKYHSIWIKKLMEKVNLIFLILSLCTRVVIYHLINFSLALMNISSSSPGHPKPTIKIKFKVNVFYKRIRRHVNPIVQHFNCLDSFDHTFIRYF
jgi:hypothetical protein